MMQPCLNGITTPLPRCVRAWALCLSLIVLPACGTSGGDAGSLDESLARDLSLAGAASVTTPVAFGDTAAQDRAQSPVSEPDANPTESPAPRPATRPESEPTPERTPRPTIPSRDEVQQPAPQATAEEPARVPAAGAPEKAADTPAPSRRILLASGTELTGTTATRVCNTSNRPGDRVVMRLSEDVTGPDGSRLEAGTSVLLELATASDTLLTFRVRAVSLNGELLPLAANAQVESEMEGSRIAGGSDKKKIIGGAIAGALIGQILGKDTRSTVIGAAGGAAAGTVAARRSGSAEACLPEGAHVRVVLVEPLFANGEGT